MGVAAPPVPVPEQPTRARVAASVVPIATRVAMVRALRVIASHFFVVPVGPGIGWRRRRQDVTGGEQETAFTGK
ncbi:hypothetical protein GCM10025773_30890 [Microbacterium jejuense]